MSRLVQRAYTSEVRELRRRAQRLSGLGLGVLIYLRFNAGQQCLALGGGTMMPACSIVSLVALSMSNHTTHALDMCEGAIHPNTC
jgi:hypothetical protein